jgi:2-amino-4-hydroxy-6-hydroxymethyldihydropteridine diphosphokinase
MEILLALGANLPLDVASGTGTAAETLRLALGAMTSLGIDVIAQSPFYQTPCFPAGAGPDYVNAAARCKVDADTDPAQLLAALHSLEARFGRARSTRWAGRTLDIDLLAIGDMVWPDAETQAHWRHLPPSEQAQLAPKSLILPHPRLQDRGFVLIPLADVAADWRHPILGVSVTQMCAALPPEALLDIHPLPDTARPIQSDP